MTTSSVIHHSELTDVLLAARTMAVLGVPADSGVDGTLVSGVGSTAESVGAGTSVGVDVGVPPSPIGWVPPAGALPVTEIVPEVTANPARVSFALPCHSIGATTTRYAVVPDGRTWNV